MIHRKVRCLRGLPRRIVWKPPGILPFGRINRRTEAQSSEIVLISAWTVGFRSRDGIWMNFESWSCFRVVVTVTGTVLVAIPGASESRSPVRRASGIIER